MTQDNIRWLVPRVYQDTDPYGDAEHAVREAQLAGAEAPEAVDVAVAAGLDYPAAEDLVIAVSSELR